MKLQEELQNVQEKSIEREHEIEFLTQQITNVKVERNQTVTLLENQIEVLQVAQTQLKSELVGTKTELQASFELNQNNFEQIDTSEMTEEQRDKITDLEQQLVLIFLQLTKLKESCCAQNKTQKNEK